MLPVFQARWKPPFARQ